MSEYNPKVPQSDFVQYNIVYYLAGAREKPPIGPFTVGPFEDREQAERAMGNMVHNHGRELRGMTLEELEEDE